MPAEVNRPNSTPAGHQPQPADVERQFRDAELRTRGRRYDDGIADLAAVDRLLHEPARLVIATLLFAVDSTDFLFLLRASGLSKGNLSSHLAKLEAAGYVAIEKTFRGKIPATICRLTDTGRDALRRYRDQLVRLVRTLPE